MFDRTAIALAAVAFVTVGWLSPAAADEPAVEICNHLKAHAVDYEAVDDAQCAAGMAEALSFVDSNEARAIADCVTAIEPVTQEAFETCVLGRRVGTAETVVSTDGDVIDTDEGDTGEGDTGEGDTGEADAPATSGIQAATEAVCAHIDAHAAEDWDESERDECAEMMPFLFRIVGEESVSAVRACVLSHMPITEKKFSDCMPRSAP